MRRKQLVFSLTGFIGSIIISGIIFFQPTNLRQGETDKHDLSYKSSLLQEDKFDRTSKEPRKGPELEKWYFEQWHQPFGAVLSPDLLKQMRTQVSEMRDETEMNNSPSQVGWQSVGPDRMNVPNTDAGYTGRILDIDYLSNNYGGGLLIAAASGGLWKLNGTSAIPISDGIMNLAVSAVTTNPVDQNIIWVGTGEPNIRGGSGLWYTTNGGGVWNKVTTISPDPAGFYKIRYYPGFPNEIHAATTAGYFRSSDGGATWSKTLTGNISDFVLDRDLPGRIYAASWGENKIYISLNFGATWTPANLPFTNVGRVSFSYSSGFFYMAVANNNNSNLHGVYKMLDAGGTIWSDISPPENYMGNQGWYANSIYYSLGNLIVGGIDLWQYNENLATWTKKSGPHVHADHHTISGSPYVNGVLFLGNDGGLAKSGDGGLTWSTSLNKIPITQYVNIDVSSHNVGFIAGGSQDNGISITTDLGATWTFAIGGDGGGVAIDPKDPNKFFITNGVYGGDWTFRRLRTTDRGVNWTHINNGIDPSTQWYNRIRHDQVHPVILFNNSGKYVYQSFDDGSNWTKLNSTPFASDITELTVAKWSPIGQTILYACVTSGARLWTYNNGTWYDNRIPTDLPLDVLIRKVVPHAEDPYTAFMVMNGISQTGPGKKIYKTTDLGVSWTNITGNLPNIPFSDVVAHPTNPSIIIASSEIGCYRTDDGGQSWYSWNLGMPTGNIVTELRYVNELSSTGKFYIVAGSYGRGVYVRELNDGSINSVEDDKIPANYDLAQNYPNPFNPSTSISFSLPQGDNVELKVYNIQGEEVATLINSNLDAGKHEVKFVANNLASGIYIYKIKTSQFTLSKKMTLLK